MLQFSFLDERAAKASEFNSEPIAKMFNLPGDDRPKPRDLGCQNRRPAMQPHWGTELRQGVQAIGDSYPVRSGAGGPTRECNDLSTVGLRPLNPMRWALDTCEPYCGGDVCREYGQRLAGYFDCLKCGRKNCKRPKNPKDCGCRSPPKSENQGCLGCRLGVEH